LLQNERMVGEANAAAAEELSTCREGVVRLQAKLEAEVAARAAAEERCGAEEVKRREAEDRAMEAAAAVTTALATATAVKAMAEGAEAATAEQRQQRQEMEHQHQHQHQHQRASREAAHAAQVGTLQELVGSLREQLEMSSAAHEQTRKELRDLTAINEVLQVRGEWRAESRAASVKLINLTVLLLMLYSLLAPRPQERRVRREISCRKKRRRTVNSRRSSVRWRASSRRPRS
jgi:hypothetical protein